MIPVNVLRELTELNAALTSKTNDQQFFEMNKRNNSKILYSLKVLLERKNSKFDVLVLTETWQIMDTPLHNISISGSNIVYNEGAIN